MMMIAINLLKLGLKIINIFSRKIEFNSHTEILFEHWSCTNHNGLPPSGTQLIETFIHRKKNKNYMTFLCDSNFYYKFTMPFIFPNSLFVFLLLGTLTPFLLHASILIQLFQFWFYFGPCFTEKDDFKLANTTNTTTTWSRLQPINFLSQKRRCDIQYRIQ